MPLQEKLLNRENETQRAMTAVATRVGELAKQTSPSTRIGPWKAATGGRRTWKRYSQRTCGPA